ncbi:membrane protein insertion efficiency factor YidD [Idiomarina xiamenensis]|uniref:Alpha-hemolysin family protein n=1 Tax=Idiomarina xiamenensis 10-D-4 TaxID=740709 RepID=K2JK63_9GAMM|nr:membrane protein insertion efficiency factor YidD [Idiomarina xiamenensis]EKE83851.1 Alpha-hemolysin family protein [Idiomarina xiamenensis 10-D-4]
MIKRSVLKAIRYYQRRGGSKRFFNIDCNFQPSCSEYTYRAIEKFGLVRGCRLGWRRICRCNDPDCVEKRLDPVPHSVRQTRCQRSQHDIE